MLLNTKLRKPSGPGARLALAVLVALSCASIAFAVYDLGLFGLEGNAVDDPGLAGDDWDQIYCDHIDPDRTGACAGERGGPGGRAFERARFDVPDRPRRELERRHLRRRQGLARHRGWGFPGPASEGRRTQRQERHRARLCRDLQHAAGQLRRFHPVLRDGQAVEQRRRRARLLVPAERDPAAWYRPPREPPQRRPPDGDLPVQADVTSGATFRGSTSTPGSPSRSTSRSLRRRVTSCVRSTGRSATRRCSGDTCAIVNTKADIAPWPYTFKFNGAVAPSPSFPTAPCFEAGLNLSGLFPGGIPCISTFLAETRQSQSETAKLEDKLIGSFDLCNISVETEGPEESKRGDSAQYTITITNVVALPLDKVSIVDDKLGDPTSQCGATLDPGSPARSTSPPRSPWRHRTR